MIKRMCPIDSSIAVDFLLPRHYSGRVPQISIAFGYMVNGNLKAVITYGKPASNSLCKGVCGEQWSGLVYELNRVCKDDDLEIPISKFVSYTLNYIRSVFGWIIVSYSDTAMNHHGYIYQACNFLYTGCTKRRTDKYTEGNKHSRHYNKEAVEKFRKVRSAKHRYVYFAMAKQQRKKQWLI